MKTTSDQEVEISRTYCGNRILLQKAHPCANWYIIVTGKDGCYRYDGYWPDSDRRNWREALGEAKRGACI